LGAALQPNPKILVMTAQPHLYLLGVAPQLHPIDKPDWIGSFCQLLHPIAGPDWVKSCCQQHPTPINVGSSTQ